MKMQIISKKNIWGNLVQFQNGLKIKQIYGSNGKLKIEGFLKAVEKVTDLNLIIESDQGSIPNWFKQNTE